VREGGRIVGVAAIIVAQPSTPGRREVAQLIGPSVRSLFPTGVQAYPDLARRGLTGVKLVISTPTRPQGSDRRSAQRHLAAIAVHFMRNALACVPKPEHCYCRRYHQVFLQPIRCAAQVAPGMTVARRWQARRLHGRRRA
jgi:transposase-like protein